MNCLAAGVVSTPMHSSKLDAIATLTDAVPLRRLAEPVDVLGSVLFLAGDASAYLTGQTIDVNGAHITID